MSLTRSWLAFTSWYCLAIITRASGGRSWRGGSSYASLAESSPRSHSSRIASSSMPLIVERMLTQKRCSMPAVELPFSGSPPNWRTLAASCAAPSAQRSAFPSKKILSCGFLTPSAQVRNPSSPSLQVSINSFRVEITSSRCIAEPPAAGAARKAAHVLGFQTRAGRRKIRNGLSEAAGLPLAGAELALVDDAAVLVAGGAEHDRAAHRAVRDPALE